MPLCCGIDPGFENYGVAIMDLDTREVVFCTTLQMRPVDDSDTDTADRLLNFARSLRPQPTMMVIENQGQSMILRAIEMATIVAFRSLGIPCKVVYAQTIKAHFPDLGFRGNRQNKRDAEALVRKLNYPAQTSHEADAILMCLYVADSLNEI